MLCEILRVVLCVLCYVLCCKFGAACNVVCLVQRVVCVCVWWWLVCGDCGAVGRPCYVVVSLTPGSEYLFGWNCRC